MCLCWQPLPEYKLMLMYSNEFNRLVWTLTENEMERTFSNSVLCSHNFEEEHVDRAGQNVLIREEAVPSIFAFPAH